jgi:multiple sugar transport system ATP-binding protein
LWTARVNPKTRARVGRAVGLAIDTSGFHFFDPDTGQAIGHPDTAGNGSAKAGVSLA